MAPHGSVNNFVFIYIKGAHHQNLIVKLLGVEKHLVVHAGADAYHNHGLMMALRIAKMVQMKKVCGNLKYRGSPTYTKTTKTDHPSYVYRFSENVFLKAETCLIFFL